MAGDIDLEVKGLKETQKKMEQVIRDLKGTPVLNAFRRATLFVLRDAKILAPVDTGRLRASITPEVRIFEGGDPVAGVMSGDGIFGVVGSNVVYAPYQELGTRFMQGKRYLGRAFEQNAVNIAEEIGQAVAEIVNE